MTSQSLQFNILTFTHPSEKLTFYFTDTEADGLFRFHAETVPEEVIAHFGEKDFYYTSFTEKTQGFLPVTKKTEASKSYSVSPDGEEIITLVENSTYKTSVFKKYYNWLVADYFRQQGCLVKYNYIFDTEVWLPVTTASEEQLYKYFDKYTLRVQYKIVSKGWELMIIYEGVSKVFRKSVSELSEEVSASAFKWLIYENNFYRFRSMPDVVRRDLANVFPVWNHAIRKELDQNWETADISNKYIKFKSHIDSFYAKHLNTTEFLKRIPLGMHGFIKVPEFRIDEVDPDCNILLFGGRDRNIAPLQGISNSGPFDPPKEKVIHFIFIAHKEDTDVAKKINRYFSNKENGFNGLEKYIGTTYHVDKTLGLKFSDKVNPWPEIKSYFTQVKLMKDVRYVAIYISPFSRDTASQSQQAIYYKIKEMLLSKEIVCQAVDANHVREAKAFVYNAVNLSIAIVAKLSGIPWRLKPNPTKELIVGVGAYHNQVSGVKYIASAFSFENTGQFNRFDHFYENQTKELAGLIKITVRRYTSINPDIQRLVIHFYKTMSTEELRPIETSLRDLELDIPVFIISVNKTESTDFIAFQTNNSYLMPYSGTFINIGKNRYLLFNNTMYKGKSFKPNNGFPFPVKMKIDCTDKELLLDVTIVHQLIEQVYQFSRMYWKSFKQQNLPVTIKYSEMVAEMLPHFEGNTIPDFGKDKLWFL